MYRTLVNTIDICMAYNHPLGVRIMHILYLYRYLEYTGCKESYCLTVVRHAGITIAFLTLRYLVLQSPPLLSLRFSLYPTTLASRRSTRRHKVQEFSKTDRSMYIRIEVKVQQDKDWMNYLVFLRSRTQSWRPDRSIYPDPTDVHGGAPLVFMSPVLTLLGFFFFFFFFVGDRTCLMGEP